MKEYLKPELEYIEFCVEAITGPSDGITGGEYVEIPDGGL